MRCRLCGESVRIIIRHGRPTTTHRWTTDNQDCPERTPLKYHHERKWWQKLFGIWPAGDFPEARIVDE